MDVFLLHTKLTDRKSQPTSGRAPAAGPARPFTPLGDPPDLLVTPALTSISVRFTPCLSLLGNTESWQMANKKQTPFDVCLLFGIRQLPIFPSRLQLSIFGV